MNVDFQKDIEEFFTQRINWYGQNESKAVNNAYMELLYCVEQLETTLSEEQRLILLKCKNAYHVADGESERFYYKAGFRDFLQFLINSVNVE